MDSRLTEKNASIGALIFAVLTLMAGVFSAKSNLGQTTVILFLGLMCVYTFASNYICLRMVGFLSGRRYFNRVTIVFVVAALLLAMSWIVFGAYFQLVRGGGFESAEHLVVDVLMRTILRIQVAAMPLFCAFIARGGWWDLMVSICVAVLIIIFTIF
jgi:hypothetical protein